MIRSPTRSGRFLPALQLAVVLLGLGFPSASADDSGTTTDLPASLEEGRFVVQAHCGTRGPFRLLLDTGANRTVLDPRVLGRLGKEGLSSPVDGPPVSVQFLGRTQLRRRHTVSSLRLGPRPVDPIEVLENDLTALSRMGVGNLDGIAGMDLFGDVRLVLDFRGRRLSTEPSGSPLPERGSRLALEGTALRPKVRLRIADRDVALLVDTGFTGSLAVPVSTVPFEGALVHVGVTSSAERMLELQSGRVKGDLVLDGLAFQRPIAEVHPGGEPLLGMEVLHRFTVRLDLAARTAHFLAQETGPVTVPGLRTLGFAFSQVPQGLRVESVMDRSGTSVLKPGDLLLEWDGQRLSTNGAVRIGDFLASGSDSVPVRVRRGKETRSEVLKVRTVLE